MKNSSAETISSLMEYAAWVCIAFLLVVAIRGWYVALGRLKSGQPMLPLNRVTTPIGLADVAVIFVVWMGAQVLTSVGLLAIAGPEAFEAPEQLFEKFGTGLIILSAISQLVVLVIGAAYVMLRYRSASAFGLRLSELGRQVKVGAVAFCMLFPIVLVIHGILTQIVPYEHPVLDVLTNQANWLSISATWTGAVFAAPLAEEFFFRGIFHNWLERLSVTPLTNNELFTGGHQAIDEGVDSIPTAEEFAVSSLSETLAGDHDGSDHSAPTDTITPSNPYQAPERTVPVFSGGPEGVQIVPAYWPILASSAAFAMAHLGQGLAPVPLFVLAVGLGYVFRQTGSLIACLVVHFMLNFYSMFMFTILILSGETP